MVNRFVRGYNRIVLVLSLFLIFPKAFGEALFTGDGRSDLSLQVENPALQNIGDDSTWIPDFVVNSISDDIKKYSNIQVSDVYNAKKIVDAQKRDESPIFNDAEIVELGNFAVAKNVLLVSITQKPSSLAISVRINDKETNTTIAAFNEPNCTYSDLESGLVLKQAVADLLSQLNVNLSAEGKEKLLAVKSTAGAASIEAQKLYARGKVAEESGSKIEALSYYVQANTSDSSLERAIKSMSQTSSAMAAGDIGTYARNAIQQRKQYIKLLEEVKKNFKTQCPVLLVYNPNLEIGKIDYEKETVGIKVKFAFVKNLEKEYLWKDIVTAIKNAPDSENWKLDLTFPYFNGYYHPKHYKEYESGGNFGTTLILSDKNGKQLGTAKYNGNGVGWQELDWLYYSENNPFGLEIVREISVPAETDTSNIVLTIKDSYFYVKTLAAPDEYGRIFNYAEPTKVRIDLDCIASDFYLNEVFKKTYRSKREFFSCFGNFYMLENALPELQKRSAFWEE